MDITLYINTSEVNKLSKDLNSAVTLQGTIRDASSVIYPSIDIQTDNISTYNYMYIPLFNRYYFIRDIVAYRNSIWNVKLECDVLQTYKDYINNLSIILSDTEIHGRNTYMNSEVWQTNVKESTSILNFPSGLNENGEFILITAGG